MPAADAERDDLAACRTLLANGSRTFLAASWLLPRAVRDPACALYAFCRLADDEVDGRDDAAAGVRRMRERLEGIYAGRPASHAADRALARVVRRHAIPLVLPAALIEGFEWDAQGRRYETVEELHAYAARVAGSVGAMMALLMGQRSPAALARACDLGVAMQLSNIARDVGEDARLGRVYLPLAWLRDAGIDAAHWLAQPHHSPALGAVVQRLLREADALYARVDAGVAALPLACRPGINAARFLYAQIGLEVERRGLNAVDARAVVSRRRKALGLARALLMLAPTPAAAAAPSLPATAYLVDAAAQATLPSSPEPRTAWWNLAQRGVGVVELFDRLERQDRRHSGAHAAW